MFGAEDRMQVESNYNRANQHYNTMVSSAEQGVYCLVIKFCVPLWVLLSSPKHGQKWSGIDYKTHFVLSWTKHFLIGSFLRHLC